MGAVLFIPASYVCASLARVMQSNLPPLSLPPSPSGNTYFLSSTPPHPPAAAQRPADYIVLIHLKMTFLSNDR